MENLFKFKMSKCYLHILLEQGLITKNEYYNTLNDLAKEYKIQIENE